MDPQPPEREPDAGGGGASSGDGAPGGGGGPGGGGASGAGGDDALRRLEEQLGRASEAAERLIAEAAGTFGRAAESVGRVAGVSGGASGADAGGGAGADAGGGAGAGSVPGGASGTGAGSVPGGGAPPAGWQIPRSDEGDGRTADLEVLSQVFGSLRELIPPELQRRLADALRELLMAIRALIDWYLERTERKRAKPSEVQDIPIL